MERLPASPLRQFLFIIAFGVGFAVIIYIATFFFPRAAKAMWYLEAWTYTVGAVFWLVDRTLRKLFGGKHAKTETP